MSVIDFDYDAAINTSIGGDLYYVNCFDKVDVISKVEVRSCKSGTFTIFIIDSNRAVKRKYSADFSLNGSYSAVANTNIPVGVGEGIAIYTNSALSPITGTKTNPFTGYGIGNGVSDSTPIGATLPIDNRFVFGMRLTLGFAKQQILTGGM